MTEISKESVCAIDTKFKKTQATHHNNKPRKLSVFQNKPLHIWTKTINSGKNIFSQSFDKIELDFPDQSLKDLLFSYNNALEDVIGDIESHFEASDIHSSNKNYPLRFQPVKWLRVSEN